MKTKLLSVAVLAAVLGLASAFPSKAQAQYPIRNVNIGYRFGPYGYYNSFGRPNYMYNYNAYSFNRTLYHPGGYRTAFTPAGYARMWASPSFNIYRNNLLWGSWLTVRTPAYFGYAFNPYIGYTSIYRPGTYAQIPLTSGYAGYVPAGIIYR